MQQLSSADHLLQPDLLDDAASNSAAEKHTTAAEAAAAASQVAVTNSAGKGNNAAETVKATKQSPLRKRLSRLFSVLSPEKAPVQQGQSAQGTVDQPQASCSPEVAASSDALMLSASNQADAATHQLNAAASNGISALQPHHARLLWLSNDGVHVAQNSNSSNRQHHAASGSIVGISPPALQPPSPTPTPSAVLGCSLPPSTSPRDDGGHWLRSPLTGQGIGRSMSETVQQLSADLQLSRDCAQALSLQLNSQADVQQLQGNQTILHGYVISNVRVCQWRQPDMVLPSPSPSLPLLPPSHVFVDAWQPSCALPVRHAQSLP